ncbi:helix-turn-helix domain-containing protein [Hymenobacter sp. HMF4947]|uniref:Helix-turn-helix domain-containing protein n=1 Tax=Hymenobacter ginkgonis TaxID=2682976 RepID=A0A7K1TGY9_9BACT|nr:AraC family transcriptional regulator [Hymenobacter ginkgonis]MVN77582.1 helix-turn-helix domain-containing protein [Hymenobacter ginkgonis]
MQLALTPVVVLLLAVVAQALLAAGLLWWARHNQLPNRLLALLMLAIALWLLDGFFRVSGLYRQAPGLYFSPIYYSLAFGPLLYFYVRGLVEEDFQWSWRHYGWHFVPVLAQAALYWCLRFQPYDTRNWFWVHVHRPYTYRVEFIGTWLSLTFYLFLSLRRLRHYRRWLADNFSEISALRLRWLRWLLLLAIVSAQWLGEVVLREFFGRYYDYDYSTELLGIVVFLIGIVGLRQADRVAVRATEADLTTSTGEPRARLVALPLDQPAEVAATPELAPIVAPRPATPVDVAVAERIRRALEDDRLFLNPTLTLAELAAHTGLAPKLISFTINAGLGQSFNDVVNGLRVAEVQRRLAAPDARRYTLLGIAFESGFNSKTTFNRIFKQLTGVAPRDYEAK